MSSVFKCPRTPSDVGSQRQLATARPADVVELLSMDDRLRGGPWHDYSRRRRHHWMLAHIGQMNRPHHDAASNPSQKIEYQPSHE